MDTLQTQRASVSLFAPVEAYLAGEEEQGERGAYMFAAIDTQTKGFMTGT